MTIKECLEFASQREILPIQDENFYLYKEAYIKTKALLQSVSEYVDLDIFNLLMGNTFLHYVIVTNFTSTINVENADGTITQKTITNTLYEKYKISDKAFIVSSASDGSSSSSLFTTDSMNRGGFLMQDLIKTPYGEYVYSILEQLNLTVVLL